MLEKLFDNAYRICIPFEDIYTTVYILIHDNNCIILDSGTTPAEVEKYVLPEVKKLDVEPTYLVCSHLHSDHSGGMEALADAFPNALTALISEKRPWSKATYHRLTDGEILLNRYEVLNLKGHTEDSLAVLDIVEQVLYTCDCLQLYGISRYGTGVSDDREYRNTIKRIRNMGLQAMIASHDYVPLGYSAIGAEQVDAYLDKCLEAVERLRSFSQNHMELDDKQTALLYNQTFAEYPPVSEYSVKAMRKQ